MGLLFCFCINEEHYHGQIASSVLGLLSARRRSLFGESFLRGATVLVNELSVLPVFGAKREKKTVSAPDRRYYECVLSLSAIAVCLFGCLFPSSRVRKKSAKSIE